MRNDRAIDSFIINKEQLAEIFKKDEYCGNVPDQLEKVLGIELKRFKSSILKPVLENDDDIIDVQGLIKDLLPKFDDFFKKLYGNLYRANTSVFMQQEFWRLQIQSCMIEAVNNIIYRTMILFIMDRGWSNIVLAPINKFRVCSVKKIFLYPHKKFKSPRVIENLKQLHFLNGLSKFTDTYIEPQISQNIEYYRKKWISVNENRVGKVMMEELSLKFAFYLHNVVENGYKYDIVKTLDKENQKDYMKYNAKWDSSALKRETWKYFLTESSNSRISDSQVEKAMELARRFFYEKGFNSGEKDFIYCVKAFFFELFV